MIFTEHVRDVAPFLNPLFQTSTTSKIRASNAGDPCDHCTALRLLREPTEPAPDSPRVAPLLGTAWHALVEEYAQQDPDRFLVEEHVTIPLAKPLGDLNGIVDLYDRDTSAVWDWKVLGKRSMQGLLKSFAVRDNRTVVTADKGSSAEATAIKYLVQLHLYGAGLTAAGHRVDTVGLILVPRDNGLATFDDIEVVRLPYDPHIVVAAESRLVALEHRTHQSHIDDFDSHPGCYACAKRPVSGLDPLFN